LRGRCDARQWRDHVDGNHEQPTCPSHPFGLCFGDTVHQCFLSLQMG
jgi:hypothetical protein